MSPRDSATSKENKNNSGLIAKTKQREFKKGLSLTEKLVRINPLLFLCENVSKHY